MEKRKSSSSKERKWVLDATWVQFSSFPVMLFHLNGNSQNKMEFA